MHDFIEEGIARIKIIGIGGAGGNAINDMVENDIFGVEFIVANTDAQDLNKSNAGVRIQLGDKLTKGLGAGSNPEIGKLAAEEDKEKIISVLEDTDMLFVTAGMGGGTGTGATPVIAKIAKELGILTIAIVTKPFLFEGPRRIANAEIGIAELQKAVDSIVVIPNDKLGELPDRKITFQNAFKEANNVLRIAVQGISEVITKQGYINLDFADINTALKDSGAAMLGFGSAVGEDRVLQATEQALNNPLLEIPISGAYKVLVNITAGLDFRLDEATEIANTIIKVSNNVDLDVMYGVVIDETLEDKLRVTVIATDFENKKHTIEEQKEENLIITEKSIDEIDLNIPAFVRRRKN